MSREIRFLPPEGVELRFTLAALASRFGAQLLDLLITILVAAAVLIAAARANLLGEEGYVALFALVMFFLRIPYYALSELVWNGRTLGKRWVGIRVISRDGRRLRPWQIAARNLLREAEVFTPLTFLLLASAQSLGPLGTTIALLWVLGVLALPCLNRHRQRLGDLVAGTVVVDQPKAALLPDMAVAAAPAEAARFPFAPQELDHYGQRELESLEELLRSTGKDRESRKARRKIVTFITQKIGYAQAVPPEADLDFLSAFYRAQRAHLEQKSLFGDRRADKFHQAAPKAEPQTKP